ncbi:hemin uptake protein HemP [Oxalobacteraceae bacterium]|nr:hemin uptake protein HemP [Oxalobacteraceae bacterium]
MHTLHFPAQAEAIRHPEGQAAQAPKTPARINSVALMQGQKELEIEHSGKIYRLRVTQLNKLILTA